MNKDLQQVQQRLQIESVQQNLDTQSDNLSPSPIKKHKYKHDKVPVMVIEDDHHGRNRLASMYAVSDKGNQKTSSGISTPFNQKPLMDHKMAGLASVSDIDHTRENPTVTDGFKNLIIEQFQQQDQLNRTYDGTQGGDGKGFNNIHPGAKITSEQFELGKPNKVNTIEKESKQYDTISPPVTMLENPLYDRLQIASGLSNIGSKEDHSLNKWAGETYSINQQAIWNRENQKKKYVYNYQTLNNNDKQNRKNTGSPTGESSVENNDDLKEIMVQNRSNELQQYTKEYQQNQKTNGHHLKMTESSTMKKYQLQNQLKVDLSNITALQQVHRNISSKVKINDINQDGALIDRILNAQDHHIKMQKSPSVTWKTSPKLHNPNGDINIKGTKKDIMETNPQIIEAKKLDMEVLNVGVSRNQKSQMNSAQVSDRQIESGDRANRSANSTLSPRQSPSQMGQSKMSKNKSPQTKLELKSHSVSVSKKTGKAFRNSKFMTKGMHMGMNLTRITEKELSTPYARDHIPNQQSQFDNIQIIGTPMSMKTPIQTLQNYKDNMADAGFQTILQKTNENSKTPTMSQKAYHNGPNYDPVANLQYGQRKHYQQVDNISEQDISKELSHEQQYFEKIQFLNNSGDNFHKKQKQQEQMAAQRQMYSPSPGMMSPADSIQQQNQMMLQNLNTYNSQKYQFTQSSSVINHATNQFSRHRSPQSISNLVMRKQKSSGLAVIQPKNPLSLGGRSPSSDLASGLSKILLDVRESPLNHPGQNQNQRFRIQRGTVPSDIITFNVLKEKEANFVDQLRKYRENSNVEKVIGRVMQDNRNFGVQGSSKSMHKFESRKQLMSKEEQFLKDFFSEDRLNNKDLNTHNLKYKLEEPKIQKASINLNQYNRGHNEKTEVSEMDGTQNNANLTLMAPQYPGVADIENNKLVMQQTPLNYVNAETQNSNHIFSPINKHKTIIHKEQRQQFNTIETINNDSRTPGNKVDTIFADAIHQDGKGFKQVTPSSLNKHSPIGARMVPFEHSFTNKTNSTKQEQITPTMKKSDNQKTFIGRSIDTEHLGPGNSQTSKSPENPIHAQEQIRVIQNIGKEIQRASAANLFYLDGVMQAEASRADTRNLSRLTNSHLNPDHSPLHKIASIQKYPEMISNQPFFNMSNQHQDREFINYDSGTFSLNPSQFKAFGQLSKDDKLDKQTELKNQSQTSILDYLSGGPAPQQKSRVKVISEMKRNNVGANSVHSKHKQQVFLEKLSYGMIPIPEVDQKLFNRHGSALMETDLARKISKQKSKNVFGRSGSVAQNPYAGSQPYATILSGNGVGQGRRLKALQHEVEHEIAAKRNGLKYTTRSSIPRDFLLQTEMQKDSSIHQAQVKKRYSRRANSILVDPRPHLNEGTIYPYTTKNSNGPPDIDVDLILNYDKFNMTEENSVSTGGNVTVNTKAQYPAEQTQETHYRNQMTESHHTNFSNAAKAGLLQFSPGQRTQSKFNKLNTITEIPNQPMVLNNIGYNQNSPIIHSTRQGFMHQINTKTTASPKSPGSPQTSVFDFARESLYQNKMFQFQGRPQDINIVQGFQSPLTLVQRPSQTKRKSNDQVKITGQQHPHMQYPAGQQNFQFPNIEQQFTRQQLLNAVPIQESRMGSQMQPLTQLQPHPLMQNQQTSISHNPSDVTPSHQSSAMYQPMTLPQEYDNGGPVFENPVGFQPGTQTDFNLQTASNFNPQGSKQYQDFANQFAIPEQSSIGSIQKGGNQLEHSSLKDITKTPQNITPLSFAKSIQESMTLTNNPNNQNHVEGRSQLSTQPLESILQAQYDGQIASMRSVEDPLDSSIQYGMKQLEQQQMLMMTPLQQQEIANQNIGLAYYNHQQLMQDSQQSIQHLQYMHDDTPLTEDSRIYKIQEIKSIVKNSKKEIGKLNNIMNLMNRQTSKSKGYFYKQDKFDQYKALNQGVAEIYTKDTNIQSQTQIQTVQSNVASIFNDMSPTSNSGQVELVQSQDEITDFIQRLDQLKYNLRIHPTV